jgi:lipoprotein-anchoring transpeptidase ErfK/SrfK
MSLRILAIAGAAVSWGLFPLSAVAFNNDMIDLETRMPLVVHPEALNQGEDGRITENPVPRETISYSGPFKPGTIVVSTRERRLYLVLDNGKALKYGVGVGRPGFEWAGNHVITNKREWPDWTPPAQMLARRPDLPRHMAGGPNNPLGARAMYLGSSLYRIHGSNEPDTIGQAVSSGCIRMTNDDVTDLYGRVKVGTEVIVTR